MANIIFDKVNVEEQNVCKTLGEFLTEKGLGCSVYVTSNGKVLPNSCTFENGKTYHIIPRVLGGKGGFGSMLRSIGAQIEKTTNREACRDLSGRRMRDVNNEQQLRDWVAKKAEREREREKRRKDRAEKRRQALTDHRHNFDDPDYHSQKMQVLERLDEALRQGLISKKSSGSNGACASAACASPAEGTSSYEPSISGSKKRKANNGNEEDADAHTKRACEWLGIDMKDLSGLETDSSDSDTEATSQGSDSTETDGHSAVTGIEQCASDMKSTASEGKGSGECVQMKGTTDEESVKVEKQQSTDTEPGEMKVGLLDKLKEIPPTKDKETKGPVNLEEYTSAVELESLGLDKLKAELMSMGLKCGGTLQQRAERLWAVKGKSKEEIDSSFFAKPSRQKKK